MPDDVLSDLQENLQEVLESTMKKYDLNYQIEESKKILTEKLDELSCKSELLNGTVFKLMTSLCTYCLVYSCSVVHCNAE